MQINKRLFELCVENFQNGNDVINYTFRNLECMDGEEERVRDEFQQLKRNHWQLLWKPQLTVDMINQLEFEIAQEDWSTASTILKEYISNRRLYELDGELWMNLLFAVLKENTNLMTMDENWTNFQKRFPENAKGGD